MATKIMLTGFMAVLLVSAPAFIFANTETEAQVRESFADIPIMIEIARCESKFTQFSESGAVLHGGMGGKMVGVFQVYGDVHAPFAQSLGMNIETLEGNLAYAKYLYEREGTTPWLSSSACWNKTHNSLSMNLPIGSVHPQVAMLQRLLNAHGFLVATEGDGSPGKETQKFGSLTQEAVRKFQCAKGIACEGDESSTGYGFVGPRTRVALQGMTASTNTVSDITASSTKQADIERLQAQIVELTRILEALLKSQGA